MLRLRCLRLAVQTISETSRTCWGFRDGHVILSKNYGQIAAPCLGASAYGVVHEAFPRHLHGGVGRLHAYGLRIPCGTAADHKPQDKCRACLSLAQYSIDIRQDSTWQLEYEGPFSTTVRNLKAISISTASMTVVATPVFLHMAEGNNAVKALTAIGFTTFGLFTTGLLHWFVGPYVRKLWYNPKTRNVKVTMLTLFCQEEEIVFGIDKIKYPEGLSPLSTFQVDNRVMFLDDSVFKNKDLLHMLTPPDPFATDLGTAVDDDRKEADAEEVAGKSGTEGHK